MKTILIPTDFSECATNASEYAAKFAKSIDANVLLLHVFHVPLSSAPDFPIMVQTPEQLKQENEHLLKMAAVRLEARTGVVVNCKAIMGLAGDVIKEEEKDADLIVMGMHGASKFEEVLLGSITTTILRESNVPVLVIPEKVEYKDPEQIVFACDFDPDTDMHTLDTLKSLMISFNPKIYVVHVSPNKSATTLEEAIVGAKLEGKLGNLEHVYHFSENEDPVEGINEFIAKKNADMVAIIPHRYNIIERLFHKSISKQMAFHTHVPLLALPDTRKSESNYTA